MRIAAGFFALIVAAELHAATSVRVVTWNLHGLPFTGSARRFMAASDLVVSKRPDFILIQEVWTRSGARQLQERFAKAGYAMAATGSFAPIRLGGLLVFVNASQWQIKKKRSAEYTVTASPLRLWESDGLAGKGILIVEVVSADARHHLTLVNTHLQAEYGAKRYAMVRKAQLDQLEREVRTQTPTILAGDFNTEPDETVFAVLWKSGWADGTRAFRNAHPSATTNGEQWIDYVITRGAAVTNLHVLDTGKLSDHYALEASVAIP